MTQSEIGSATATVASQARASTARRRFVFTVAMNLVRTGISFGTSMLAARWLGPGTYGNMAFLLGTFAGLRALLDMGSSAAFFTFLSQKPRSWRFVRGFFAWQGLQFVVPMLVIGLLFPASWITNVWRGQPRPWVLLAFAAAFFQGSVWSVVQQACESQRRTYLAQGAGVVIAVTHVAAIALFWRFGVLGIPALLAAVALEYVIASVVVLPRLEFPGNGDDEAPREVIRRFVVYCFPFVPFAAVSFFNEFVDRWLLQRYGGGVQQAFYAVGAQLASIALIATSSILSIFWKEIAEAHHRGDHARTSYLYHRVNRLLFFVGAAVAGMLIPWATDLLRLILGEAYVGGAAALMIMLMFPIHQAMGQIGATMMYATERVRTQVLIGIAMMCLGMISTYFVLAPPTNVVPGLGLASTGLAVKMVGVQIVSVNVLAFTIARIQRWSFDWIHQPLCIGACVALGWTAHALVLLVLPAGVPILVRLIAAGVLYAVALAATLYGAPALAGLTRAEIRADLAQVGTMVARMRGAQ